MSSKRNIMVYLETHLIDLAKVRKINLSAYFNECLKTRLNIIDESTPEDIKLLRIKIAEQEMVFAKEKETLGAYRLKLEEKEKERDKDVIKEIEIDQKTTH